MKSKSSRQKLENLTCKNCREKSRDKSESEWVNLENKKIFRNHSIGQIFCYREI